MKLFKYVVFAVRLGLAFMIFMPCIALFITGMVVRWGLPRSWRAVLAEPFDTNNWPEEPWPGPPWEKS